MTDSFAMNFLVGGASGAIAKTSVAPIVRLHQLYVLDQNLISIGGNRYNSILDCFKCVVKARGVKTLWDGNLVETIRYFPTQAIMFAFKDGIKGLLLPKAADKHTEFGKFFVINMACGGLAGAGYNILLYPLDCARTHLASDIGSGKAQFHGIFDCIKKIVASGGIGALYKGIGISFVGTIPYRAMYFGFFDTLSANLDMLEDKSNIVKIASKFACAQVSSMAAMYLSYPFSTVYQRLQMQSKNPKKEWVYDGIPDCFAKIIKHEGASALFLKSFGTKFFLNTFGASLVLVLYSEITSTIMR